MLSSEIVEGLKQFVRVTLLAVIPLAVAQLQSPFGIDWKSLGVALAIAVLTGVDKWLHLSDVKTPLDLKSMNVLKG